MAPQPSRIVKLCSSSKSPAAANHREVSQLTQMGFPDYVARKALAACVWDVNKALDMLLSGTVAVPVDDDSDKTWPAVRVAGRQSSAADTSQEGNRQQVFLSCWDEDNSSSPGSVQDNVSWSFCSRGDTMERAISGDTAATDGTDLPEDTSGHCRFGEQERRESTAIAQCNTRKDLDCCGDTPNGGKVDHESGSAAESTQSDEDTSTAASTPNQGCKAPASESAIPLNFGAGLESREVNVLAEQKDQLEFVGLGGSHGTEEDACKTEVVAEAWSVQPDNKTTTAGDKTKSCSGVSPADCRIECVAKTWGPRNIASANGMLATSCGEFLQVSWSSLTEAGWVYAEQLSGTKVGWVPVMVLQSVLKHDRWMRATSTISAAQDRQMGITEGVILKVNIDSCTGEGWVFAEDPATILADGIASSGWVPVACLEWTAE